MLACECPGDNEDDEVLLPVDFRTLEEHFGFGGEGEGEQPELVDEDGRMDPGPVGTMWDHGWGKQSVTNIEHDEMRGTWGEVICFAFFFVWTNRLPQPL